MKLFNKKMKKFYLLGYLTSLVNTFKEENRIFHVDIIKDDYIDVQIMHPLILEKLGEASIDKFGFVVVFSFNISDSEYITLFESIQEFEMFKKRIYPEDNVTYYRYCGDNVSETEDIVLSILEKVFGYDEKTVAQVNVYEPDRSDL